MPQENELLIQLADARTVLAAFGTDEERRRERDEWDKNNEGDRFE